MVNVDSTGVCWTNELWSTLERLVNGWNFMCANADGVRRLDDASVLEFLQNLSLCVSVDVVYCRRWDGDDLTFLQHSRSC